MSGLLSSQKTKKTTQLIAYQKECVQMKYKEMIKSVMYWMNKKVP